MFRKLLPLLASVATALTMVCAYQGAAAATDPASSTAVVSEQVVAMPQAQLMPVISKASAATLKRYTAMRWAKTQAGKPYCYGGEGTRTRNASCYDCSGLVMTAYLRAGVTLPRTTGGMWNGNRHMKRISASQARWGDIVMPSSGHVELVSAVRGWMFGAHHSGTRIGFKRIYGSSPRYFRVV